MASSSNPQFLVDDQTDDDEDFFDKLVDDSYSPTQAQAQAASSSSLKFEDEEDGSDSDVTKAAAIANLDGDVQLNESANPEVPSSSMWKEETSSESAIANLSLGGGDGDGQLNESANTEGSEGPSKEETSSLPMEETKLGDDDDVVVRSSDKPLLLSETVKESGSPGVKEVDWGSFCAADSSVNDGAAGFGSYSDFFTELEGSANAGNLVSNDAQNNASFGFDSSAGLGQHHQDVVSQNSTSAGNFVSNDTKNNNASFGFEQHQGEVSQDSTSGQYVDNNQAWENSYPGWKYDANTGQWYQVDTHDPSMNAQESYINSASNWESSNVASTDVSYLRQSTASAVAGTAESMSTWNQVSQVGNGYPEHMVLDPQYPGWYYDTIAQEWRSLDSYNQASQTTATSQAHDQQAQNVHALGALYHNNTTDSNIYNVNDKSQAFQAHEQQAQNAQAFGAMFHNNTESSMYNINDKSQAFKAQDFSIQNQQGSWDQSYYANNQQQEATNTWQSERSPDGRPPHPLVSFGFGGKLIVLKDSNGSLQNSSFGSQGAGGSSISVLNLAEVTSGSASFSSLGKDSSSYFRSLHQQCLPGPLVGGSVGSKDLIKWLDERILQCESSDIDFSRGKLLKMLLSLLRISCQYYGKLRSPFGADTTQKETDSVEAAVAKLFAFAKNNGVQNGGYAPLIQCLQHLPPESQMQATASEVQNLLAFGRKMEALQCAQEGHLWGPALVIAAQLGDQFYADTVKQMALRQLVPGSPLRTLCLLVAGQPAEVFSNGSTSCVNFPGSVSASQHQTQFGSSNMLDNWEENLGIITANRTTDDELVITHLGDCMWKERSEIIAAHICYLIADKNFDPYSDSARLCLVGADHWKYPRTYASPEAIQRTEVYEYSKTLGNSQYILLPFQPYKIIYAHMLAEVGKLSAAQKYCQAVSKCLKTGRSTEVETWKQFVSSLEERIRIHQQGGYTVNSSPAKIVGKLLNFFDSTAHRVVGGMPPPAPHSTTGNLQANGYQHQQQEATKLPYSQSANTMQSLMSQASMEPIRERGGNARTMAGHSRSVSEPDFGRTPLQPDSSKDKASDGVPQVKSTVNVTSSRFGSFGFGILRNTVRRVLPSRPSKEAKLGDENQFYYDEKLKRWVEKGVEPPAEEAALPPPPTVGTYRSNSLGYENKSDMKNEMSPPSGSLTGIPPISQGSNQFSARGRPRSRYVDTYNPGSGNSQTMFQSAHAKSAKPPIPSKASFFIPAAPANDQVTEMAAAETRQEYSAEEVAVSAGAPTPSAPSHSSFQSPAPSPMTRQRFPSLDNINGNVLVTSLNGDFPPPSGSRRTASWSGSLNNSFTSPTGPSNLKPSPLNGSSSGSLGEELQEVEL